MPNLLEDSFAQIKRQLSERNFEEVELNTQGLSTGTGVTLAHEGYLGTICFWPPNTVEIHFLERPSGLDAYLETKCIEDAGSLFEFLSEALEKIGIT